MSIVAENQLKLKQRGEYVVLANASSGWFAVNPKTWQIRSEQAVREGRSGPSLVVYRTKSGERRDHYVIPHEIAQRLLTADTLRIQSNGRYRWNLTLKEGKLHVTHRPGFVDVSKYYGSELLVESVQRRSNRGRSESEGAGAAGPVLEGIAREAKFLRRTRNRTLRRAALTQSGGVCEVCDQDFSKILDGEGLRALQVHHKRQLSLAQEPVVSCLEDLAVVCSNCHAMIHADPKSAISIEVMRDRWTAFYERVDRVRGSETF